MKKRRIIINCEENMIKDLKRQAVEITDLENNAIFTPSRIIENCINDLIDEKIKPKRKEKNNLKRYELRIDSNVYYLLHAESERTGYNMTELIYMAYVNYNPDVNKIYNIMKKPLD